MRVTRRPALPADGELARRFHHLAYRDAVERQFGSWDEAQQDRFFAGDWAVGGFEIVLCDGEPCGYVCVEDAADHVHVRELVVAPAFQRRGVGTALLREALARARARGVPVRLGTFHSNRALALYRRLGFVEIDRTATHVVLEHRGSAGADAPR